uniref:Rho GTPase-activating protein 7 n=1 Tax=Astyanax mexicanus TaxID=7994 RepID=A0A3B1JSF1_ASTMX
MPVALSKRSWEDHVTPRSKTQYSYDDLDLVCSHGIVEGNGSPAVRSRRPRCASMPECRRRRHRSGIGVGVGGEKDESDEEDCTEVTLKQEDMIDSTQSQPNIGLSQLEDGGKPVDGPIADQLVNGHVKETVLAKVTSKEPDFDFNQCEAKEQTKEQKINDVIANVDTTGEITNSQIRDSAKVPNPDIQQNSTATITQYNDVISVGEVLPTPNLNISTELESSSTGLPENGARVSKLDTIHEVSVVDSVEKSVDQVMSSREDREKERSRLDSMVLLIMKLDQLDQEIESALSSAPSSNGTPTLKRRIISVSIGSLSSQPISVDIQVDSSSSLSSAGPSGTPGAKPKNRVKIEAKEACTWLRAAGFPQYAQLYEDGQFPTEISSVTRDHDFLDRDAIEALCRRLNTLNKCALMRLEITPQRKRSEDSDDDEPCAISGRWTFQRDSKRWSRLDQLDLDVFSPPAGDVVSQDKRLPDGPLQREGVNASAESVLTDLSEQPEVGSLHSAGSSSRGGSRSTTIPSSPVTPLSNVATASTTRASSVASICSSGTSGANEDSLSDGIPSPLEHGNFPFEAKSISGSSGGGKSTRSRAKSFLKRMESLRLRSSSTASKRKKKGLTGQGRLEIGGPVLKEGFDEEKLRRLNCIDIATLDRNGNRNRSISYSTQTSSGSTGSSQSETSSGSAVSTPSPVTRARSHSTAVGSTKRAGMYLEGFDPFNMVLMQENEDLENQNRGRRLGSSGMIFFYLPEGHKPGTFPKALADGGPCGRGGNLNRRVPRQGSSTSLDSRLSFYDNVPFPEMGDEEEEEPEGEEDEEEPKMEEVLEQVSDLQRLVKEGDSDSALDSASPCPSSPLQNRLEEAENGSDQESPLGEQDDSLSARERRDSGVGASLTRTNRWHLKPITETLDKLRWPSFQNSHRPSATSSLLQVSCQSVLQMNLLQKYSLLKLTALLEKHTPTNKHGFSWAVPKFMKRTKVRDFKDRSVFGVPLQVNVQRSGQPLPQGIQQAMRYLRNHCLDQVGLFRKSGVKSRIQALRQMNESCGTDGCGVTYEGQSAYDVADMLKQYFRDLPEPLFTSKLTDTFLQIYQYMPVDQRLQAVRAAVLLLPDESRETLQTLLCFLSDVTANVRENQMTCMNLAVCLAPSLFHLNTVKRDASSPRVMSRKNALGKPDQRDLNENLAATHGLAHMIQECRKLFQVPEELSRCRNSYVDQALSPLRMDELQDSYRSVMKENVEALLKEAKDRFRGYESCGTPENAELACRKVRRRILRQWKVCVEVPVAPEEVLQRILREQARWDEDLLESRVVETLDGSSEVYQYVRNTMAPHPPTDHVEVASGLRSKVICRLPLLLFRLTVKCHVVIAVFLDLPSAPGIVQKSLCDDENDFPGPSYVLNNRLQSGLAWHCISILQEKTKIFIFQWEQASLHPRFIVRCVDNIGIVVVSVLNHLFISGAFHTKGTINCNVPEELNPPSLEVHQKGYSH